MSISRVEHDGLNGVFEEHLELTTSFPIAVYVKGKHLSHQRGKRNTNPNTSLLKIEGVDDTNAAKYVVPQTQKISLVPPPNNPPNPDKTRAGNRARQLLELEKLETRDAPCMGLDCEARIKATADNQLTCISLLTDST